ncbi:hypothetical protein EON63_06890 [archaeon]|nr:MAG: hypothetical protein EON63_06890 [archaeon]
MATQLERQEYLVERAGMSEQEREETDNKSNQSMPEHRAFDINKFKVSINAYTFTCTYTL